MEDKKGFATMMGVILIVVLVSTVSLSMSLVSVGELKQFGSVSINHKLMNLLDACTEDLLLRLNKNGSFPSNLILPLGSCTVTTNSLVGNTWDLTLSSTVDSHTKQIKLIVSRTTSISITQRTEVL